LPGWSEVLGYGFVVLEKGHARLRFAVACATGALCSCGLALAVSSASAATTYTWGGVDSSSAGWSVADNWAGDAAPSASDTGDLLDFPASLTGGDCENTQDDACYVSEDDIPGYSVDGITLDDGGTDDYLLEADADNDVLELGAGGITASTTSSDEGGAEIGIPLELTASQTWSIDGGPSGQGQLVLDQGLSAKSATSDLLTSVLENYGVLGLSGDNEVGEVSVLGDDRGRFGTDAAHNGWVDLDDASLDSTDGQPVTVENAGLTGTGTTGPLEIDEGFISPGDPSGTLAVDGPATIENTSYFVPLIGAGSDRLTAAGGIVLHGAYLDVQSTDDSNTCPTLESGTTYTILSTSGSLTGSFNNAPSSGDTIDMDCSGVQPQLTINYNTTSSPETVTVTTAAAPTPTPAKPLSPTVTELTSTEAQAEDDPGAPITLNATVTSTGGTPQGSVEFEESVSTFTRPESGAVPASSIPKPTWTAIAGCSSVPVLEENGSAIATCKFTNPPAGNYLSVQAVFVPGASSQFESSTSNGFGTPIEGPPEDTSVGLGLSTTVKGDSLVVTMRCPTGNGCDVNAALAAKETLKHGRVVAASATTKTVIVATDTTGVAGGATKTITLRLNRVGRELLKEFHHLTAKLSISSNTLAVLSANFTFKQHH
jgi:hypothetical protein